MYKANLKNDLPSGKLPDIKNIVLDFEEKQIDCIQTMVGREYDVKTRKRSSDCSEIMTVLYLYFCRSSVKFKQALIRDLSDSSIVRQLRILGLIGKYFSGPWMVQFYGNELERKHLEMVPLMKDCIQFLESVSLDPSLLVTGN